MTGDDTERVIQATVEVPVSEVVEALSTEELTEAIEGQYTKFVVNSWEVPGRCVDAEIKSQENTHE